MEVLPRTPRVSDERLSVRNPPGLFSPTGYSQVAEVRGGRLVFVAGQVAMDATGSLVGAGDYRAQAEQVFRNLETALRSAGATFRDVVKLNYYLLDVAHLPEVREVRDRFVDAQRPPTSTAVQVARLFRPEFLLEVDAVASVA
jgi:enamine deaminase RidA (YjgF/YER057c/UK114 family)